MNDHNLALRIVYRDPSTLIPYANNSNRHTRRSLKHLAKIMEQMGFTNPILIDSDNMVIAGHGRLEAAKMLGMTSVPTVTLSHLSEAQIRAYIIADNVSAKRSSLDNDMLRTELSGLIALGYDVHYTGLTTLEIDTVLNIGEDKEDDEVAPEGPSAETPVTRLGDIWTIGKHRLICGDARTRLAYENLLRGQVAQMIFADPPYNVAISGNVSGLGQTKHSNFVMASGEMSDSEFEIEFLRPAFRNMVRFSIGGAIAFICMDWRGNRQLQDAADGVFSELKNLIVWAKPNAGMGSFYRSQYELIFAYKVRPGTHINNFGLGSGGRHRSNLWTYSGATSFSTNRKQDLQDHPTVKSKKMVADAILDCSHPDGIVLDPFAGSGTTLVAADMVGRRGYGIELDPKYCDVILRRMEEQTGLVPSLNGEPFPEVALRRKEGADD